MRRLEKKYWKKAKRDLGIIKCEKNTYIDLENSVTKVLKKYKKKALIDELLFTEQKIESISNLNYSPLISVSALLLSVISITFNFYNPCIIENYVSLVIVAILAVVAAFYIILLEKFQKDELPYYKLKLFCIKKVLYEKHKIKLKKIKRKGYRKNKLHKG